MENLNPKIKITASTSIVNFMNISNSYYDMIISIQNSAVNQSVTMKDTEGNDITEQPVVLTTSVKIILKDVKIGSILFSDTNSYNIIISYIVKREASGIPYIDFDYSTGNQNINSTRKIYDFYSYSSGSFNSTTFAASDFVPNGYIAHILGIFFEWDAKTTNSTTNIGLGIYVNGVPNLYPVGYTTMNITSGDHYACSIGEDISSNSPGAFALSTSGIAGGEIFCGFVNIPNLQFVSTSTFSLLNSVEDVAINVTNTNLTVRYILEPVVNGV